MKSLTLLLAFLAFLAAALACTNGEKRCTTWWAQECIESSWKNVKFCQKGTRCSLKSGSFTCAKKPLARDHAISVVHTAGPDALTTPPPPGVLLVPCFEETILCIPWQGRWTFLHCGTYHHEPRTLAACEGSEVGALGENGTNVHCVSRGDVSSSSAPIPLPTSRPSTLGTRTLPRPPQPTPPDRLRPNWSTTLSTSKTSSTSISSSPCTSSAAPSRGVQKRGVCQETKAFCDHNEKGYALMFCEKGRQAKIVWQCNTSDWCVVVPGNEMFTMPRVKCKPGRI